MFWGRRKFEERISSMENTLGKLERSLQGLELEWLNAYAKFRKIAGRIAKDQAVIDSREADTAESPEDVPTPHEGGSGLSLRQKQIQQQILRRRGGGSVQ